MKKTIEELLEAPYWVVDILPGQVPAGAPGSYFAVEKYFLEEPRRTAVKQKHINVILKLNCYRSISLDDGMTFDPPPERIAEEMLGRHLCIRVDEALIVSEPDDTYMTLYDPDERLLGLIRTLAAGEGLYVWQPPEGAAGSDGWTESTRS